MALSITHSKTLIAPDTGSEDKVYGQDYVSASSHTLAGVASLAQGGTNNATGTATVNANLTGHVTSTGNAAVLGSFTVAQLNTAISDADVATGGGTVTGASSGTNTGDQTVGTIATQNANNVAITGGSITGVTGVGYQIASTAALLSPADGLTYYQGLSGTPPITTAATIRAYVPFAGTLTDLWLNVGVGGTLGDSAQATVAFRLNNTTDTNISTAVSFTAASQVYSLTGQAIALVAGDYFQIKLVCPTWATTNPTNVVLTFTGFVKT